VNNRKERNSINSLSDKT